MKTGKVAKTELGQLLACLSGIIVENPRQAKRRADYLKKVRKLVRIQKAGKHERDA